jgi:rhodanese/phosphatase family protein
MTQPLPNTYWVLPGRLLAGEHPYGKDDADTLRRLDQLRDAGINYFVDLTEENEMPSYRGLLPEQSHYLRCSIRDTEVPAAIEHMQELQSRIRTALKLDRRMYVHCRAGIGRTGLVIGCYLAEEGLEGQAALDELNRLWRQSECAKSWPVVPQTEEQADYIRSWPKHRRSPKRVLAPPRLRTR